MSELKLTDGVGLAECNECPLNNSSQVLSHLVNKEIVDILVIGQCYSSDTEVLTDVGWKLFKDLNRTERIATLNPQNNVISYHQPIKYLEFNYEGKMYNIRSNYIDLLVTPDHNVLVNRRAFPSQEIKSRTEFVKARDFNFHTHRILRNGVWLGQSELKFTLPSIDIAYAVFGKNKRIDVVNEIDINIDDWLAFFGFWIAEGWTYRRKHKNYSNSFAYYVGVGQNDNKKCDEFEVLLKRLPFKYKKKIDRAGFVRFFIYNKQLYSYLEQFGKCYNKHIPNWIKFLSTDKLKILFDWMMKGDGNVHRGCLFYTTTSKQLADDVQEIALKLGLSAIVRLRKRDSKYIKDNKCYDSSKWRSVYQISIIRKVSPSSFKKAPVLIDYFDKVYCVEVPNHVIYVRRNGRACWCGNSPGLDEVKQGRPFIGRSGNLINPVLNKYSYGVAYINVINCRPLDADTQKDRQPLTAEVKCCRPRFDSDFDYVLVNYHPKIIVVLGAFAKKEMQRLMKTREFKMPIYFTEHPAYILRNEHLKPRYITGLHNNLKSVFGNDESEIVNSFISYTDDVRLQFMEDVNSSIRVGVDIETNSLNMFDPTFVIGTVAVSCDKCTYFFDGRQKDIREYDALIDVLKNERVQKIFADIMFDVVSFEQYDIKVNNYTDLFPLAYIHDNTFQEYSLAAITMRYLPELAGYKAKFQSTVSPDKYLEAPTSELRIYNSMDAYATKTLYNYIYERIEPNSKRIFERITLRMLPMIVMMKVVGMKVDIDLLEQYEKLFQNRFVELSKFFTDKWGITNINSTLQIKKWLFETLKLKPVKFNEITATQRAKGATKGSPSTDKEVLEIYAAEVPETRALYEARRVANVLNYFLASIKNNTDFNDIIHPNLKHYGISSYRLSCSSPNLQGIPRDETKIEFLDKYPLRRLFRARYSDSSILEFDFSQQEVRIVAELARDEKLLDAFAKGKDVHAFVGSIVFDKPINEITKLERQIAKGCVFGAIFGASYKEMSIRLHIPEKQARAYLTKFFALFSSIDSFIKRQHRIVLERGVITTILGRPRRFIMSSDNIEEVKREAGNHVIQAVAVDITFLSLIRIYEKLRTDNMLGTYVIPMNTVHDSILFDVRQSAVEYANTEITAIMSGVPKALGFNVVYPVEVKQGRRWDEKMKGV